VTVLAWRLSSGKLSSDLANKGARSCSFAAVLPSLKCVWPGLPDIEVRDAGICQRIPRGKVMP